MVEPVKKKHPGGRPKLILCEDDVYDLAKIHCTSEEIANIVGCSVDTLERGYAEIIKKGRDEGKSCLRRHQMRLITECNSTAMAIWLGKVYLKQRELDKEELKDLQVIVNKIFKEGKADAITESN